MEGIQRKLKEAYSSIGNSEESEEHIFVASRHELTGHRLGVLWYVRVLDKKTCDIWSRAYHARRNREPEIIQRQHCISRIPTVLC